MFLKNLVFMLHQGADDILSSTQGPQPNSVAILRGLAFALDRTGFSQSPTSASSAAALTLLLDNSATVMPILRSLPPRRQAQYTYPRVVAKIREEQAAQQPPPQAVPVQPQPPTDWPPPSSESSPDASFSQAGQPPPVEPTTGEGSDTFGLGLALCFLGVVTVAYLASKGRPR